MAVLLTAGGSSLGTNVNTWYARMASFVAGATADDASGGSGSPIGYEVPGGSQAPGNSNDGNGNGDGGNGGGK